MQEYSMILHSSLFKGISEQQLPALLAELKPQTQSYTKGQTILAPGQTVHSLALILSGRVLISKQDFWGNRNLLSTFQSGDCFAETFACSRSVIDIQVEALSDCTLLWIPVQQLFTGDPVLMQNLLQTLALRNLSLTEKLSHLGHRTTRDKLLSYLSAQSMKHNSPEFDIPFNRQQLSDYLLIERSGCSAELCKMRDEGLIDFHKNHFLIKK